MSLTRIVHGGLQLKTLFLEETQQWNVTGLINLFILKIKYLGGTYKNRDE